MNEKLQKAFKVAAVSSNTNSFGLYGTVLLAKDGEAFEVAVNGVNKKVVGDIVQFPVRNGKTDPEATTHFFFEIPRILPKAPTKVVDEVWAK